MLFCAISPQNQPKLDIKSQKIRQESKIFRQMVSWGGGCFSPPALPLASALRKAVKRTLFYAVLAIERYANRNASVKAGIANYFSKLFVELRKVDLSPKLLGKILVSFAISLARLLIYNFTKFN